MLDNPNHMHVTVASVDALIKQVDYGYDLPNVVCCLLTTHIGFRVVGFSELNVRAFSLEDARQEAFGNAWFQLHKLRLYEMHQAAFDNGQ